LGLEALDINLDKINAVNPMIFDELGKCLDFYSHTIVSAGMPRGQGRITSITRRREQGQFTSSISKSKSM
tara:strand:+ start:119170 stop:119379 length:210 start_codon:yes stop_codon:yes gene_type:complete